MHLMELEMGDEPQPQHRSDPAAAAMAAAALLNFAKLHARRIHLRRDMSAK